MNSSFDKPDTICWVAIPLLLFIGLLTITQSVNFYLHDTYFVVTGLHLAILFALILAILGLGYRLVRMAKGVLVTLLTKVHLGMTLGGMLLMMGLLPLLDSALPGHWAYRLIEYLFCGSVGAILLSQPCFLINLLIGILRSKVSKE